MRLSARRIYILPTRAGLAYLVILAGMLLGGLNFANSLALLLCFMLGSLGVIAMLQCHHRLIDLDVLTMEPVATFAGRPITIRLAVRQPHGDPRDLRARCGGEAASFDAHGTAEAIAPPARRGRWRAPVLRVEQSAPFGLFQAWALFHVDVDTWIWPEPAGDRAPPGQSEGSVGAQGAAAGLDEWAGLRPFREGDSPRRVAWKAYARGAPLLVREYVDPLGHDLVLDYAMLDGLPHEERLSQLARWIVDAEAREDRWSLRGPDFSLPLGGGPRHRIAGLDALARSGAAT